MRTVINLGRGWTWHGPDGDRDGGGEKVDVPHSVRELPLNGFDERAFQFVSLYERDLAIPARFADKRIFLDFDGVMTACEVSVGDRLAGTHVGGFTPFSVEITGFAKPAETTRISVRVDSRELPGVPPFGNVVDYLCYGGIYRDVRLRVQESAFVSDIFARPVCGANGERGLEIEAAVDLAAGRPDAGGTGLALEFDLLDGETVIASARARTDADGTPRLAASLTGLAGIRDWSPRDPKLYAVRARLARDGVEIDRVERRIGWRDARFTPRGFFLNGERIPLVGLNRHQSWPYAGFAMSGRAQRRDAEILRRELGVTVVRTSHYPQSPDFLDACDELGLLVFEELPGWQHIGDDAWKDRACRDLEDMILRDRNRPSVVLWGVRINESRDDRPFYERTNAIARRLDPSRQTGGVRYVRKSELLEDVYTFNDFSHDGSRAARPPRALLKQRTVTGRARNVPYLVTEHTGHMYPAKRFDNEERLREHALRHARAMDAALGDGSFSGAVGWCAFDYNTHKDFGSGDRMCYHGVCDAFRFPKYAAFAYASQADPRERIVLEPATLFARGERDAARMLPFEIWTNCDSVVLYRSGERVGEYLPDRAQFPNLPHPPVVIRDLIGERLDGAGLSARARRLVRRVASVVFSEGRAGLTALDMARIGFFLLRHRMGAAEFSDLVSSKALGWGSADERFEIAGLLAGKEAARRTLGGDARAERLSVAADDGELLADAVDADFGAVGSWDTTRIAIRALDQYGNAYPFVAEALRISVRGPATLIGPSLVPLTGGVTAVWIRTTGEVGTVMVEVESGRFPAQSVEVTVRRRD